MFFLNVNVRRSSLLLSLLDKYGTVSVKFLSSNQLALMGQEETNYQIGRPTWVWIMHDMDPETWGGGGRCILGLASWIQSSWSGKKWPIMSWRDQLITAVIQLLFKLGGRISYLSLYIHDIAIITCCKRKRHIYTCTCMYIVGLKSCQISKCKCILLM